MIISCPSCETRYQVDEAKFPPQGRNVRCAKCGNNWHQASPEPETAVENASAAPAPAPTEAEPAPKVESRTEPEAVPEDRGASRTASYPVNPQRRGRTAVPSPPLLPTLAVVAGWICLIAAVLVIAVSAVRYRQDIAVIWPQSAGVYSTLGMKVNASGIDFRGVDYHREIEDGTVVLAVTGSIVNAGKRELPVPQMVRVTLSDASNHELYHWTFTPKAVTLKPGQSIAFVTRLSSPPIASRHLEVRFAKDGS